MLPYMPTGELTVAFNSVLWAFCDAQEKKTMGDEAVSLQGYLTFCWFTQLREHPTTRALDHPWDRS